MVAPCAIAAPERCKAPEDSYIPRFLRQEIKESRNGGTLCHCCRKIPIFQDSLDKKSLEERRLANEEAYS